MNSPHIGMGVYEQPTYRHGGVWHIGMGVYEQRLKCAYALPSMFGCPAARVLKLFKPSPWHSRRIFQIIFVQLLKHPKAIFSNLNPICFI